MELSAKFVDLFKRYRFKRNWTAGFETIFRLEFDDRKQQLLSDCKAGEESKVNGYIRDLRFVQALEDICLEEGAIGLWIRKSIRGSRRPFDYESGVLSDIPYDKETFEAACERVLERIEARSEEFGLEENGSNQDS